MKLIETWFIVLCLFHIALFLIALGFFMPKKVKDMKLSEIYHAFRLHFPYLAIIIGVVFIHLLEVNVIDPITTDWIGVDFANEIHNIEGDAIYWFSQHWTPVLVYFFVFMYIAVYPFTLWFSPLYFIINDEKKSMKTLSYGLLLIYVIAVPFYLFMPVTNVYRYYGLESALEAVIPTIENFFYATTTQNNCLPSLHVAMTILIAWSVHLTGNKKLSYFAYFCMISVILSVIYLAIHWITDIICGVLLAILVIFLLNHFINKEVNDTRG